VALVGMFKLTVAFRCYQYNIIDLGTSGCGKSTIIQLLERFYDVGHGHLVSISLVYNLRTFFE